MKIIDGSILEGGGQILRMSIAFSSLLNIPIRIEKIRAGREKPGLKAQHMTGIKLVQKFCKAIVKNCELKSTCVEFVPTCALRDNECKEYSADIGTAGAITLLCQISLPCLLFSGSETGVSMFLKGGTNVGMAPQIEYYNHVFRPNLNRFGVDFECKECDMRKGYFPKGGGHVNLKILPIKGKALNAMELIDPGIVNKITIFSSVAGVLPIKMAHTMADAAISLLTENIASFGEIQTSINVKKEENAFGNGSSIVIIAETSTGCILGGSCLGSPKQQANLVGQDAAMELLKSIKQKGTKSSQIQSRFHTDMYVLLNLCYRANLIITYFKLSE